MPHPASSKKQRLSLSAKTLIGLGLGVACGLFFGELCSGLQVVGDAFVGLLQMTVLPYIAISLIASVGRLSPQQSTRLCTRLGVIALIFWLIGLLAVVLSVSTFPARRSAAFYSNAMSETPAAINFLDLFIPTNPFRSLANNWIPAVIIFCVSLGAAVMAMPNKASFLSRLDDWLDVLKRLNGYVVLLTPYGVFAIVTATAGTMTMEEFASFQAYLLSFTAAAIVLTFLVLPTIIMALTPFRYRDIVDVTLQAMITAFATAKLIVVLPLLIERTHELFARYEMQNDEVKSDVEVIYPLMYPIPNLGKLLTLIFIPFVGWYFNNPIEASDYPSLLGLGSLTYFGKPIIAMPFLLDVFQLPSDVFHLFIVADIYCSRIGDVLGVMHLFALTALGACATRGMLKFRPRRLLPGLAASVVVSVALFAGVRTWLDRAVAAEPSKESIIEEMQLLRHPSPAVVLDTIPEPSDLGDVDAFRLDAIKRSSVIRVGFMKDNLPYSFFNKDGKLVGYDIDMSHLLADDLNCRLEFVPFTRSDLDQHLAANDFDFAASGLAITTASLLRRRSSEPYLNVSLAFVVKDYRRKEFASLDAISQIEDLTIAVPDYDPYRSAETRRIPNATLVPINGIREFFEDKDDRFDGLLVDAERGAAWTFRYPNYRPVTPHDLNVKVPIGLAVAKHDFELSNFLSRWIEIKQSTGELDELKNYWIYGQTGTEHLPRWSILRNVLGVDLH